MHSEYLQHTCLFAACGLFKLPNPVETKTFFASIASPSLSPALSALIARAQEFEEVYSYSETDQTQCTFFAVLYHHLQLHLELNAYQTSTLEAKCLDAISSFLFSVQWVVSVIPLGSWVQVWSDIDVYSHWKMYLLPSLPVNWQGLPTALALTTIGRYVLHHHEVVGSLPVELNLPPANGGKKSFFDLKRKVDFWGCDEIKSVWHVVVGTDKSKGSSSTAYVPSVSCFTWADLAAATDFDAKKAKIHLGRDQIRGPSKRRRPIILTQSQQENMLAKGLPLPPAATAVDISSSAAAALAVATPTLSRKVRRKDATAARLSSSSSLAADADVTTGRVHDPDELTAEEHDEQAPRRGVDAGHEEEEDAVDNAVDDVDCSDEELLEEIKFIREAEEEEEFEMEWTARQVKVPECA